MIAQREQAYEKQTVAIKTLLGQDLIALWRPIAPCLISLGVGQSGGIGSSHGDRRLRLRRLRYEVPIQPALLLRGNT
jgi:hypothetical protein